MSLELARLTCYIICVEETTRNPSLVTDLAVQGIEPEGLLGVDFRNASEQEICAAQDTGSVALLGRPPLSGGEIGCVLSHRLAWRTALASTLDWLLVVEDDVEVRGDLRDCLDLILAEDTLAPTIVSLIHLQDIARYFPLWAKPKRVSSAGVGLHRSITQTWGTGGYVANRAAVRLLATGEGPELSVADWPPEAARCRFYVAIPPPLLTDGGGTLIPDEPTLTDSVQRGRLTQAWSGAKRRVSQYWRVRRRVKSPLRFLTWNQGAWPLYGTRIPTWTIRATKTEGRGTLWWWRWSGRK